MKKIHTLKMRTLLLIVLALTLPVIGFFASLGAVNYWSDNQTVRVTDVIQTTVQTETKPEDRLDPSQIDQAVLLSETNRFRAEAGLRALTIDPRLNASALAKCNDMVELNYWGHDRPDGTEPWIFLQQQNVEYLKAGENLAYGFYSGKTTVRGWMNSPSHRANLLEPLFDGVGYGTCESNNYQSRGNQLITVQHFITR